MEEDFYSKPRSITELAEYLGISKRFVQYEVARGNLKVLRLSANVVRLLPADIKAWMDERTSKEEPKRGATKKEAK
jgi:excisionase family DNA binding protein